MRRTVDTQITANDFFTRSVSLLKNDCWPERVSLSEFAAIHCGELERLLLAEAERKVMEVQSMQQNKTDAAMVQDTKSTPRPACDIALNGFRVSSI